MTKLRSEVAKGIRLLALATVLLYLSLAVVVLGGLYVRSNDLGDDLKRHTRQIEFLCESNSVLDIVVRQEAAFLRLVLKTESVNLGANEREVLRERAASLEAIHFDLSAAPACRGIR